MSQDPNALLAKAEKELSSAKGGWSFFGSSRTEKYETASDLFKEAANAFSDPRRNTKMEAGKAFERAGECLTKTESGIGAPRAYIDAARAYSKVDPAAAVRCREVAVDIYRRRPEDYGRAAEQEDAIADLYAGPLNDAKSAIKHYQISSEWRLEASNTSESALSNKSLITAADLASKSAFTYNKILIEDKGLRANVQSIDKELLEKAIELYEVVAENSINHSVMRYSVKDYLLKAGLCRIAHSKTLKAQELVGREIIPSKYSTLDPSFPQQREGEFLIQLAAAFEMGNREEFSRRVTEFKLTEPRKAELAFVLEGMITSPVAVARDHTDHVDDDDDEFS